MARTKKTRGPEELLKSMNENTDEKTRPYVDIKALEADASKLEEVDEADDVELDEAEESDPDKTTELDLASKRKPAARKPRAPRKKKEPAVVAEEITQVLEPKTEAAPDKVKKEKPSAEKKAEEPRAQPKKTEIVSVTEVVTPRPIEAAHKPDHLREDVSIATASLEKTMDSMVHQWKSVKEISTSISHELERVNTMLKTPAVQADPADIKEYLRQAAPRITLANKIALGASAAAAVFSIISLSLSSSTRHRLLEQIPAPRIAYETRAPKIADPVKAPAPEVVAPKPVEAPPAPVAFAPAAKVEPVAIAKKVEKRQSLLSKVPLLTGPKSRPRTSMLARERRAKSSSRRIR